MIRYARRKHLLPKLACILLMMLPCIASADVVESVPPELERVCPGAFQTDKLAWETPEVMAPAHRIDVALPWLPAEISTVRVTIWRTSCPNDPTRTRVWLRFSHPNPVSLYKLPTVTVKQGGRTIGRFGGRTEARIYPPNGRYLGTIRYFRMDATALQPSDAQPIANGLSGALINDNPAESFDPAQPFSIELGQTSFEWVDRPVIVEIPAATRAGNAGFLPQSVKGHWWNPSQPGTGLILSRNERETLFAAWMTYDDDGRTTWFVMPEGIPIGDGRVEGKVYSPLGQASPIANGLNSQPAVMGEPVGQFSFRFLKPTLAEFKWSVRGVERTEPIEQIKSNCIFDDDVWIVPRAAGWAVGVSGDIFSMGCHLHTTLLTYDRDRKPVWYFAALADSGSATFVGYGTMSAAIWAPVKQGALFWPTGPSFRGSQPASSFRLGSPVGSLESVVVTDYSVSPFNSSIARFIYTVFDKRMELDMQRFRFEY